MRGEAGGFDGGDLLEQDLAHRRVLVAQVDVDGLGLDRPGGDQHAFEELVRLALQVVAVLEGAGLALVAVDRHQARAGLGAHEGPLAPGREAGAAEAAQAGIAHGADHRIDIARAAQAFAEHPVAVAPAVLFQALVVRHVGMAAAGADTLDQAFQGGAVHVVVADLGHRRAVAAAHAGRADDADPAAEPLRQAVEQRLGAQEFAGQTVADPDGQGRRQRLVVEHDVEVGIEGRDLVDLRHGNGHEAGERVEVAGLEAALGVLDEMEVLDQQVAPVGAFADHFPDIRPGRVVEYPAFRVRRRLAAPGSRMNSTFDEPSCLAGPPGSKL